MCYTIFLENYFYEILIYTSVLDMQVVKLFPQMLAFLNHAMIL